MSILGGGLRSIVSGVEQILLESDEEYEEEISLTKEEKIQNLQSSDDTYLTDPLRSEFPDWLKDFLDKIETKKEEMTEILIMLKAHILSQKPDQCRSCWSRLFRSGDSRRPWFFSRAVVLENSSEEAWPPPNVVAALSI